MAERLVGAPDERAILRLAERVGTSERRILGWEPTERHEHYSIDEDGTPVLTGVTIVKRDSEWDDATRNRHLALEEHDAGVHANGCGLHESIAKTDPHWRLRDDVCPVCADLDAALRERDKQEHDAEKDLAPRVRRQGDGRRTSLQLLTPAEIAALKPKP